MKPILMGFGINLRLNFIADAHLDRAPVDFLICGRPVVLKFADRSFDFELSPSINGDFVRAAVTQLDPPRIGSWMNDELILEPPSRAAVDEIDPRPYITVNQAPVGFKPGLPLAFRADEVTDERRGRFFPLRPYLLVRAGKIQSDSQAAGGGREQFGLGM